MYLKLKRGGTPPQKSNIIIFNGSARIEKRLAVIIIKLGAGVAGMDGFVR